MNESSNPGKETLHVNESFKFRNGDHESEIRLLDLADYRGLATVLNKDFRLDWGDIFLEPKTARLHMYSGADKNVSIEEKLVRMEAWAQSILDYDSLMVQTSEHQTQDEIQALIKSGHLPRIETVVLDTATIGLIQLLTKLNYKTDPNPPEPFVIPWSDLVEKARSGELVSAWKQQKGI